MKVLTVADRELRSAARQKATYRMRWVTAVVFFGLLLWLLWAFGAFRNPRLVPEVFVTYSVLALLYCMFLGSASTADTLSSERREGTLGLLFLTNLRSGEIVGGKLCSKALATIYGLMAIFPMLALPMLMGGITFAQFGRTVVALLAGIAFSLGAGFLASAVCKRQFVAIGMGTGLTFGLGCGLLLLASAFDFFPSMRPVANAIASACPLYTLISADGTRLFGQNLFWPSVGAVLFVALGFIALATLVLAKTWRDRPTRFRFSFRGFGTGKQALPYSDRSAALRTRLLEISPFFWLAGKNRVSAPVFMVLAVAIVLITVFVTGPLMARLMGTARWAAFLSQLIAWLWAGLAIHCLVLYYAALISSQRLAEDKQTGALELIFSTPLEEKKIHRGLWLAFWRKMLFPGLIAVLVHLFFLWHCLVMFTLEQVGSLPLGTTPLEIFSSVLLNQPLRGRKLDWEFYMVVHGAMLVLLLAIATWPTLGYVGRWLGVRLKHPGFAPVVSLALLAAPPVVVFTFAVGLAEYTRFNNMPERRFIPILLWFGFSLGIIHCLVLCLWARGKLNHELRALIMSRYQPLPAWRLHWPSWRTVRRVAATATALVLLAAALAGSYYGYQNRRATSAWRAFLKGLNDKGESLALAPLLPKAPLPDENLAECPGFRYLSDPISDQARILEGLPTTANSSGTHLFDLAAWQSQTKTPLHAKTLWSPGMREVTTTNRANHAEILLKSLKPLEDPMGHIAEAARTRPKLQFGAELDAGSVLHTRTVPSTLLERLAGGFQVRACARLAVGQVDQAADDVLTGLRLAHLARQLVDVRATTRAQEMAMQALQPIWEGLSEHVWTEPQLEAFQKELAAFRFLADYTNSVNRVVRAQIELWRGIPDSPSAPRTTAMLRTTEISPEYHLQPRAWWYDNCIQLYMAGQNVVEQPDLQHDRVPRLSNWGDTQGLPLHAAARDLLMQYSWWYGNRNSLAFSMNSVNQAVIACALERYRLRDGAYPTNLTLLSPSLLENMPRDTITGRLMVYQAPAPGGFALRGAGPNAIDDTDKGVFDDWIWAYNKNALAPKVKKQ